MNNTALHESIDRWVSEKKYDMLKELFLWVAQPSVSRADLGRPGAPYGEDCRRMLDLALARGAAYGYEAVDYDGYVGELRYGDQPDSFGFVCHLDVVPEGEGWIYAPYAPVIERGFVIGRGASDNKGAAILVLFAMNYFREQGIPLKKQLRFLFGCAEETGMDDFKVYLNRLGGAVPPVSIVADAAFPACYAQKGGFNATVTLPAGADIVSLRAGRVRNSIPDRAELVIRGVSPDRARALLVGIDDVQVEAEGEYVKLIGLGRSGHAAFPEGSKNAIHALADGVARSGLDRQADLSGIAALATAFSSPYGEGLNLALADEPSGRLTLNAGVADLVGDDLRILIDIRFPVTYTAAQVEARLRTSLEPLGATLSDIHVDAPYYLPKDDPTLRQLTDIYESVAGVREEPYAMGGGTYSRVIPGAISFGPGFRNPNARTDFLPPGHGSAHGPDEALFIEDWLKALKVYILTVYALAG